MGRNQWFNVTNYITQVLYSSTNLRYFYFEYFFILLLHCISDNIDVYTPLQILYFLLHYIYHLYLLVTLQNTKYNQ